MADVVCIGSLTLDLLFQDNSLTLEKDRFHLALGGKYVAEQFHQSLGGGGANVSLGLMSANISSALWSEIGVGGLSLLIEEHLKENNINCSLLEKKEGFTRISAILVAPSGERTIITHRSHKTELSFNDTVKKMIKQARILYLGNMPELSIEFRREVVAFAKNHGLMVALNFGVKDCRRCASGLKPLLQQCDYLIVNRYELADIVRHHAHELILPRINYHADTGLPPESVLVVTDGEFGAYAQTNNAIIYQKAFSVTVRDTTGAGDAFTSGFLAGVFYKKSLPEALASGARNSSSVIQRPGAQNGLLNKEKLFK